MIDTERLARNRDQIWAEGYQLWAQMCREHQERTGNAEAWRNLPLMLSGEAAREAEALQEMAR